MNKNLIITIFAFFTTSNILLIIQTYNQDIWYSSSFLTLIQVLMFLLFILLMVLTWYTKKSPNQLLINFLLIAFYSISQFLPNFTQKTEIFKYGYFNDCMVGKELPIVDFIINQRDKLPKSEFLDIPITYNGHKILNLVSNDLFLIIALISFLFITGHILSYIYLFIKEFKYDIPNTEHFKLIGIVLLLGIVFSLIIDLVQFNKYEQDLQREYTILYKTENTNFYQYKCNRIKNNEPFKPINELYKIKNETKNTNTK